MNNTRAYWLSTMLRIVGLVFESLAKKQFKNVFPLEVNPARAPYAPLEAFGRSLCGIAPWLEVNGLAEEEKQQQAYYRELCLKCLDAATDPDSPDCMVFDGKDIGQPLVDAAFLCHGLLRAPNALCKALDHKVRKNLLACLQTARQIVPGQSNWLLFSAMVEAGISLLGGQPDLFRVDNAFHRFYQDWYKGDGIYGDGTSVHNDYYNSFVIHPMFVDVLIYFKTIKPAYEQALPVVLTRAQRYAAVLERLISPEGTYPMVGRSIVYRFGAFQLLSQAALEGFLPEEVTPAQVRCALTSVLQRTLQAPLLDESGFLLMGVLGHQPALAEEYINIGSLYLCSSVFLPLGLNESHPFWADPDALWTNARVYGGENVKADHAIHV